MCGICGMVSLGEGPEPDRSVLAKMNGLLVHRGPDDEGSFCAGGVALSMRRLSIQDVQGGAQPAFNEDGSVVVVYNGEIYNSPALREELEARGHRFRSRSDTEILVHLWEEKREKLLDDLAGMFAFALWDVKRHELLLARDRLGKKPLYWTRTGNQLVFASELKALRAHPGVRPGVDRASLGILFALQYIPSPRTPFVGVSKLAPGHLMLVRNGNVETRRYWRIRPRQARASGYADAVGETRRLLAESVRMRLLSDVPLGALLSGGLDSSAVVGLMAGMVREPVKTFTVSFDTPGGRADTESARAVAAMHSTDHTELVVGEDEALRHADRMFDSLDEPILDPACLPTLLISELARTKVTVALTGEGGDESFGGYARYRLVGLPGLPLPLARTAAGLLEGLGLIRARTVKAVWAMTTNDPARRHLYSSIAFAPGRYRELFGTGGIDDALGVIVESTEAYGGRDALNRDLAVDTETWLADDLLQKVDRMSMAVSLEARTPFLDHTLQEYLHGLPGAFKVNGGPKGLLRDAVRGIVPDAVLGRKKVGFEPPWGGWFRGRLRGPLRDAVSAGPFTALGVADSRAVRRLLDAHERTGRFGLEVFSLYALAEWARRHAADT